MTMRTPLKRIRYLGSAKEGADHFWMQRLTAVANIVLITFLIWLVTRLAGADHATTARVLANPFVSLPLLLLLLSATMHMKIGMQVIIEDYVHAEGRKIVLLMLNTFFVIAVGAASVMAVLKLTLGA